MDGQAFLSAYHELLAEHQRSAPELDCVSSTGLIGCGDCVFSSDLERCFAARYSTRCRESFDITHCTACANCYSCTFCQHSQHCAYSNYLIRCVGCIRCDYCFGCVGLDKKHFYILNQKYTRKQYFALVKELEQTLSEIAM